MNVAVGTQAARVEHRLDGLPMTSIGAAPDRADVVGARVAGRRASEQRRADDALLVVTHGLTMRLLLMRYFNWSPQTFDAVCTTQRASNHRDR